MRHLSEFEGELRQLMEDDKGLVSAPEQPRVPTIPREYPCWQVLIAIWRLLALAYPSAHTRARTQTHARAHARTHKHAQMHARTSLCARC